MDKLSGIILAGGKSSRFKSPKYLAKLKGKSLLQIAIAKLEPLCQEIIIVSKESDLALATGYFKEAGFKNLRSVLEKSNNYHPLIGIKEGLRASRNEANIILACDMPFVSKKTILKLFTSLLKEEKKNNKAKICLYRYKERAEPLLGFYRKACLPKIVDYLQSQFLAFDFQFKVRTIDVLSKCDIKYIDIKEECIDFFNVNTKEDLNEAEEIAQRNPQLLSD